MEQVRLPEDTTALYEQLDAYDWDNDTEFQGGLRAILSSATPDQAPRLIIRARCYFFARKFGKPVDFQGYLNWTMAQSINPPEATLSQDQPNQSHASTPQQVTSQAADPMGSAPPPASFAEICELIAEGKPIPGIKDIPDTVLEGQATPAQAPRRKKPWEKDASSTPVSLAAPASPPSWARAS